MEISTGLGFDVHRLVEGRPCILGGVLLPHPTGPDGHSDGDAVLHAICDALLGAAGLDDLGTRFPNTDSEWKDADSADLLRASVASLTEDGWRVGNIDIIVATEGPRIAPHRAELRASIASLIGITPDAVNIKGKSLEGLGALANGAGIAVQAICLITRD